MASKFCNNSSSRSSGVDFRPKGFFESRGWSRSSRRSRSNPSSAESSPRAEPTEQQPAVVGVVSGDEPTADDDYQYLFARVWQTSSVAGTSPSESTPSPSPRSYPAKNASKPSTSSSWRRYGFKRGGDSSATDCQKNAAPSSEASTENWKVGVPNAKRGTAKGEASSEYTTVSVGEGKGKRVQYTISSEILRHHLFQVLLKCSLADDADSQQNGSSNQNLERCVSVSCDLALFLQLVRAVAGDGCLSTETGRNMIE